MPFGSDTTTILPTPEVLPREFYDQFLSDFAKAWKPAPIWDLFPLEHEPGMLSLLIGKPNPATAPFTSLSIGLRSPNSLEGDTTEITLSDEELKTAMQYNVTRGMPPLVDWMTKLTEHVHGRSDKGWKLSLAPGSQDLLNKVFGILLNPGDTVIVECATYPSAIPSLNSLNSHIVEVAIDANGIIPSSLEQLLENWPADKRKPKLLYTIPYGCNPSGATTSQERRIEVLRLARKYNFLILEDDPYFYLYFGAKPRPASYFSLEHTLGEEVGRVIRLDTFSKVLAAGFRFGWVTGPPALLDVIDAHSTNTTVQCSSLTQVLYLKTLTTWGISGFLDHTIQIAEFYRAKRDRFEACLRRHMTGLAEWATPEAGMFYWVKLLLPPSSDITVQTVNSAGNVKGHEEEGDSTLLIRKKALEKGVLVLPGSCAFSDNRRSPYVRMCFSFISDADVDEALRRLASAIREEWDAANHD